MTVTNTNGDITTTAKPFLKWAGGKGQLLPKFKELYPAALTASQIKKYHEPFLGSGAVFFDVMQQYNIKSAYLYDVNEELVLAYRVVQEYLPKLLDFLYRFQATYRALSKQKRSEYFYEMRTNFNLQRFNIDYNTFHDNWIPRTAQLIFLNKTCFNGLFRVNSKGEFNTPAGAYANPVICDETNLLAVSKLLDKAVIKKADFTEVVKTATASSFIYFDPPYRPISKTAHFKAYHKENFGDAEQLRLAGLFRQLDKKGVKMMLSNSDPKNHNPEDGFFDDMYKGFNIMRVPAKRIINADASKRGKINELVITNY